MTTIATTADERQGLAKYYHSTLYKFTTIGRAAVLEAFSKKVGNIGANCSYDAELDIFFLECPHASGSFCDQNLLELIDSYILQELEADRLGERQPEVQRFPLSRWTWEDRRKGDEDQAEDCVSHDPPPAPLGRPVTAHLILAKDPEGKLKLKFFRPFDLPDGLLQRMLSADTPQNHKMLGFGLTCRAVRWKDREGYVFNGRDGSTSPHGNHSYANAVLPDFPVLSDARDEAILHELDAKEEETPAAIWEHDGEAPPVDQWLLGVGQTKQVLPDVASDYPKETQKLVAIEAMHGVGRARVPTGYHAGAEQEDSSDDESVAAPNDPGFSSMFQLSSGNIQPMSDSSSDSSDSDKPKAKVSGPRKASFNSMLPKSENRPPPERMNAWSRPPDQAAEPAIHASPAVSSTVPPSAITSSILSKSKVASTVPDPVERLTFHQYDKKYGRVDDVGLTGDAGHAAAWAQANYSPKEEKKQTRNPVLSRTRPSDTPSAPASVVSMAASTTRSRGLYAAAWEGNVSRQSTPSAKLIDATSKPSSGIVPPPPGLTTPSRPSRPSGPFAIQQTETGTLVDADEVSLMDSWRISAPVANTPHAIQTLQPGPPETRRAVDKDAVVDTLAIPDPNMTRKRSTMQQKAGKNTKGSRGKSANNKKPKAELPLPDPLPPPRAKKLAVDIPKPKARPQSPKKLATLDPFSKLLCKTIEKQIEYGNEEDEILSEVKPKLVIQFGQILTRSEEKSFAKQAASSPDEFQELLNLSPGHSSRFFPRLTTSASDGKFLINKLTGADEWKFELEYEIHIMDAAGWSLICTIPADDKDQFTVRTKDQATGHSFMHYPVHVWDARMTLLQPGVDRKSPSHEAIAQFASSMETDGSVPSFLAYIHPGQFVVKAVLAHRVFKNSQDGVTSRVVETQHLEIFGSPGGRYNFCALAQSEAEMINYQRIWWEASLETEDLGTAEELRNKATSVVQEMDAVGLGNVGPWLPGVEMPYEQEVLEYDELAKEHFEKTESRF